jgi:hypothetical protein
VRGRDQAAPPLQAGDEMSVAAQAISSHPELELMTMSLEELQVEQRISLAL